MKAEVPAQLLARSLESAEAGDPGAQYLVGCFYKIGHVVDRDVSLAARWWRAAAEQGHVKSQVQLAILLEGGTGVRRDVEESVRWLNEAAVRGAAEAQRYLGRLYWDGVHVPEDRALAVAWWERATEQGDGRAAYNLARACWNGVGTRRDRLRALRLVFAATIDQEGVDLIRSTAEYESAQSRGRRVAAVLAIITITLLGVAAIVLSWGR